MHILYFTRFQPKSQEFLLSGRLRRGFLEGFELGLSGRKARSRPVAEPAGPPERFRVELKLHPYSPHSCFKNSNTKLALLSAATSKNFCISSLAVEEPEPPAKSEHDLTTKTPTPFILAT